MMKLAIATILEEGQKIELNPQTSWVQEMLAQAFPKENPDLHSLSGSVFIQQLSDNLNLKGSLHINLKPHCDRCGELFLFPFNLSIQMNLVPSYQRQKTQKTRLSKEEEINKTALSDEDLNFAFYEGVEIDLQNILREQMVLALPIQFLCSQDCRGLCLQCGVNLNVTSCTCLPPEPVDPRWEALKQWKKS